MTAKEKAANAKKWIDALPGYKQAAQPRGMLGEAEQGYCCLGAGCHLLGVAYDAKDGLPPDEFIYKVGLNNDEGEFSFISRYEGEGSLINLNDHTEIGFKGISNFLKKYPDWVFDEEVAELIQSHYEKVEPK